MTSVLDQVVEPDATPMIATILGDAGLGKTSLAASFPKPVIIRAEDGVKKSLFTGWKKEQIPALLPVLKKPDDLWDQLTALIKEDHPFKTVVIDSVTALETMFVDHIVSTDPKQPRGIQQALGGYGAGRDAVSSMHRRVRKAAARLVARGINVVFIAHAETVTVTPPDADSYTKYSMRLHEKSMQPYVDDVDLIGFLRLQTALQGKDDERRKAISDGTRQLICYAVASNVSKNRFGITEPIDVMPGVNPLEVYLGTSTVVTVAEGDDDTTDQSTNDKDE